MQQGMQQNIYYRHFDLPANFPVIGLLGDSWKSHPEPITRMHFHNCMEIGFLYSGTGKYHIGNQTLEIQAPCMMIAPPNIPHAHSVDEGQVCGWKWIYVDPQKMLPNLSPRLSNMLSEYQRDVCGAECVLRDGAQGQIMTVLKMIIDEMENGRTHYHHVVRELFATLFLLLLRNYSGTAKDEQYVNSQLGCIAPAIAYIAENFMEDVSIEKLSRLCHVSVSHFRRLFKQVLGWSPLDYVQMVRIDRACVLLYNCDFSITEIGLQVGYPSPSSFNRQFRRIHGVSPSQWRQKMRSEENPVVTAYFNSLPPSTFHFFPMELGAYENKA
ncbi:MAG: helix-turn-helix transcriptional regulator [Clostridia bacterium]|nr:helix-turn-helix transcriptional regulator [Clostridia bacterium]